MQTQEILFLLLLFVAVFILLLLVMNKLNGDPSRKRAGELALDANSNSSEEFVSALVRVVDPISKLSLPSEGWENSPLQIKFINAGWRDADAPKIFFGLKTLLTFGLPLIVYLFIDKSMQSDNINKLLFSLFASAGVGFYAPNFLLKRVVDKRQGSIIETMPDATDLLIICMEAGLSFDLALAKVSSEIKLKSEVLSQEFELLLMEMRSGFTRERALRNLALRTGIEEMDTLATMVIQSERFGTSIGEALRVYAETARTKRRQRAEETAAKIALKLLFPLLVCLMPATFVVLLVPSMLQIGQALSK